MSGDRKDSTKVQGRKADLLSGTRSHRTRGKKDKGIVNERKIAEILKETSKLWLEGMTPQERVEWLSNLPNSVQQQYLTAFIPKVKDVDGDLKLSHLSLTKSFDGLPDIESVLSRCRELVQVNKRLCVELNYYKTFVDTSLGPLSSEEGDYRKSVRKLVMLFSRFLKNCRDYVRTCEYSPLNLEAMERVYGSSYDDLGGELRSIYGQYGFMKGPEHVGIKSKSRNKKLNEGKDE